MNYRIWLFFLFAFVLFSCQEQKNSSTKEQTTSSINKTIDDRWLASDYRNENWKPQNGKYYFSEQWTWSFLNETKASDDPHHQGIFSVFVDPPSGTILLTRAASLYEDEMTDWIVIHPDGTYIIGFTDEHGKKVRLDQKMIDFPDHESLTKEMLSEFKTYFKAKDNFKIFGTNKYGNPTIKGQAYTMSFLKTTETSDFYLGEIPFSLQAFYLVQKTNPDLRFPINIFIGYSIPSNFLILSEHYIVDNKSIRYELTDMSASEYFLDISSYKKRED